MLETDKNLLNVALSMKDAHSKALTNFMFREIIEDAHVKYKISQEDMKVMCKEAVNRAALFITIQANTRIYRAFAVNALEGVEWDEPEMTEELFDPMAKMYETLKELSE